MLVTDDDETGGNLKLSVVPFFSIRLIHFPVSTFFLFLLELLLVFSVTKLSLQRLLYG